QDAIGILQVSAMDRTTGREQSLTIQGSSTLSEEEVQTMIREAEEFSETDRLKREQVEKRNRAEALTYQAERVLRDVVLDFGMQFARDRRRRIERLIQELRECLAQNDERGIDITQSELQDEVYELNREAYLYDDESEESDLLGQIGGTLRRTFSGGDERDDRYEDSWSRRPAWEEDAWDYNAPRYGSDRRSNDYGDSSRYQPDPYAPRGGESYRPPSTPYRDDRQSSYSDDRSWNPPNYGQSSQPPRDYRDESYPQKFEDRSYQDNRSYQENRNYQGDAYRASSPFERWSEPEDRYSPNRAQDSPRNDRDWNRPPETNQSRPFRENPPRDSISTGRNRDTPRGGYRDSFDNDWGDEDEWL
ncbi:MAG: Hsp70 family protein, partial [Leptolyngbya sp. SIO1D8]|nr:Hsp70 family protein [Leptolyngbya sp. SIO1D8]